MPAFDFSRAMRCLFIVYIVSMAMGCSSTNSAIKNALSGVPASQHIVCNGDECSAYWDRARLWITKHTKGEIQIATDELIESSTPSDKGPSYGFDARKEAVEGGRYRITIRVTCGSVFGCIPKEDYVKRAFYHYVQTGEDLIVGLVGEGDGIY